jgi:hypothetical protein
MSLFDAFKKKKPAPVARTAPPPAVFASGAEALDYACKYLECTVRERSFLPALVVDARTGDDGNQLATLRVASADGGFIVSANTLGPRGPQLKPGDLVAWQAGKHQQGEGWIGIIIGTLRPELRDGRWLGEQKFSV